MRHSGAIKMVQELNPMHYYRGRGLDRDSAFYNMTGAMRAAYNSYRETNRVNIPEFSPQQIIRAAKEAELLKREYDKSTFLFGTDLVNHFLGNSSKKMTALLVDGMFYGETNFPGVIAKDVTNEMYEHFHNSRQRSTNDVYLTTRKVHDFIESERQRLRKMGFRFFEIKASKFFFFNEEDIDDFNLEALLPLVADVYIPLGGGRGYVNAIEVKQPSLDDYLAHSPRFVSHRLKISTAGKLAGRLVQNNPITLDELIKDIAAHRVIVIDEAEAYRAAESLGWVLSHRIPGGVRIGRHQVKVLEVDDHYKKPKSQYKGINLVVEAAEAGARGLRNPTVREIQIVERRKHYKHEIDVDDKAHHLQHDRKKTSSKKSGTFYDYYEKVLKEVWGAESLVVQI